MENTKDKIIIMSYNQFLLNGYKNTSINKIISKLGISKGSFFHYFKDKKSLFLEVMDYFFYKMAPEGFYEIISKEKPKRDDIINMCKIFYKHYNEHNYKGGCLLGNMSLELSNIDEFYRKKLKDIFQKREKSITDFILRIPNLKPKKTAETITKYIIIYLEGIILVSKVFQEEERSNQDFELFLEILDGMI